MNKNGNFVIDNTDNAEEREHDEEYITDNFGNGFLTVRENGHYFFCLTIIGQIEGHIVLPSQTKTTKYEHVIPRLLAAGENEKIDGILLLLHTVGGDIEAGLAIAELISGLDKPVVSVVLGGGHSIGIPLAVCADRSFIVPSAAMTVHPVRMNGLILGVPQTFEYFHDIEDRILNFVCGHSRINKQRLRELMTTPAELTMDLGTILSGEEAVREGIIDRMGTVRDAIESLKTLCENKNYEKD